MIRRVAATLTHDNFDHKYLTHLIIQEEGHHHEPCFQWAMPWYLIAVFSSKWLVMTDESRN